MRIPLSNVNLGWHERQYAALAVQSGWISGTGENISKFETALAQQVNRNHALAVTNGTVALELVLRALDIRPGDEVIVPALTFVAPAAAVRAVGATPVFVDITEESWTIDPAAVCERITRRTAAVIAVDLLGHPADFTALNACLSSDVMLIEDAAQAHGAKYQQVSVGECGDISTFSFHANKTITTGEGGAVLTDNAALASRLRLIANHGMSKERPYYHEVVGSNYRMTNVTAGIGLGQVERWDELVAARNKVAATYDRLLVGTSYQRRPVAEWATEACWLYALTHPERDRVVGALRAKGIDSRALWPVLPDLPLYAPYAKGEYSVARRLAREGFWLPTWAGMPEELIEEVCAVLIEIDEPVHEPL